ncbi:TPA: hypothetical protein QDE50_10115 [Burkholderia cenocepacia]|nr:hypothetical protein [Burkholderia cenocepacia]HDR9884503.1 hypothetical protein [Burkholderia cenocepacia]
MALSLSSTNEVIRSRLEMLIHASRIIFDGFNFCVQTPLQIFQEMPRLAFRRTYSLFEGYAQRLRTYSSMCLRLILLTLLKHVDS